MKKKSARHSEHITSTSIRGQGKRYATPRAATKSENGQSGLFKTALGCELRAIWERTRAYILPPPSYGLQLR